jgi:hypothetical protein
MEDDYLIDLLEACGKRARNKLRHSCGTLRFVRIESISLVVQSLDLVQTLTFGSFWAGRVPNVHDVDHSR